MKFKYAFIDKNNNHCYSLDLNDLAKHFNKSISNIKYHVALSKNKLGIVKVETQDVKDLLKRYGNNYTLNEAGLLIFSPNIPNTSNTRHTPNTPNRQNSNVENV